MPLKSNTFSSDALNPATLQGRIDAGVAFMATHKQKAKVANNRYLDSSAQRLTGGYSGDEKPLDLPVGEINQIAINIRQKVASLAIANPDWKVESQDPKGSALVRDHIRKVYHIKRWGRLFRRVFTERFITGLAFVAYSYDPDNGFILDYVKVEDLSIDPHTKDDNWDSLRWAARKVKLPVDVAIARYGDGIMSKVPHGNPLSDSNQPDYLKTVEKETVDIWVYYDAEWEIEFYNSELLKKQPNLYGRVPICVLQGDVNPDGEFALGDYDTSLGVMEALRRQTKAINNVADNGGGVLWLRSEFIDATVLENVIAGKHQGPLIVKGVPGEQAMGYTPNQALNPAVLEATRMFQQALQSDQGVTDLDQGIAANASETATQSSIRATRSASRSTQARIEFEKFVEEVMTEFITCEAKFGLDPGDHDEYGPLPTDEVALWQACKSVEEIRLIEESMGFKDPQQAQQQSMQLFDLAVKSFELMNQLGLAPNLKKLFDDVLRTSSVTDVDDYYLPSPGILGGVQQGQPGSPQQPQPPMQGVQ
jgi:hypothetical protein